MSEDNYCYLTWVYPLYPEGYEFISKEEIDEILNEPVEETKEIKEEIKEEVKDKQKKKTTSQKIVLKKENP